MNNQLLFYSAIIILIGVLLTALFHSHKKVKKLESSHESLLNMNKNYLDMLGFVSHELKGIIGSVIMSVYSVRDGFLGFMNFKQSKALDSAVRNLERLSATVKNYLDLSRIEKGELSVKRREVNLNEEIIKEAVDTFSKQFSEKEIILDSNVPKTLKVFADRDLIITVYNNLLSNAMKYGTTGGRINLQSEDRGEYIRLSVYNDGIPISEGKIE